MLRSSVVAGCADLSKFSPEGHGALTQESTRAELVLFRGPTRTNLRPRPEAQGIAPARELSPLHQPGRTKSSARDLPRRQNEIAVRGPASRHVADLKDSTGYALQHPRGMPIVSG